MSNYVAGPDDEIHDKEWANRLEANPLAVDKTIPLPCDTCNKNHKCHGEKLDKCPELSDDSGYCHSSRFNNAVLPCDQSARIKELKMIIDQERIDHEHNLTVQAEQIKAYRDAVNQLAQSNAWINFGECRGFTNDAPLSASDADKLAKSVLERYK